MSVAIIYPRSRTRSDGIADYSVNLAESLRDKGVDASVERPDGIIAAVRTLLRRRKGDVLSLQYNPFAWGRWGFAPWLVMCLALRRGVRSQMRIHLMVHEAYVARIDPRSWLMGTWQRLQLRCLLRLAHVRSASTECFVRELRSHWPRCSIHHLPVGSNLPDRRSARERERVARCIDDHLVVGSWSTGHDSLLTPLVFDAIRAIISSTDRPVALLLLGPDNPPPGDVDGLAYVDSPGYVDSFRLGKMLAAVDVFLAPYSDGGSTRRTTLMAALQYSLPTVTTTGPGTDAILDDTDALVRVPIREVADFAATATALALDPAEQHRLRFAARELYERAFDWPVLARRALQALELGDAP